jgi:hypothetical protein
MTTKTTRVLYSPGFGAGIGPAWTDVRSDDPVLVALYDRGATKEEVQDVFPNDFWHGWKTVKHTDVPEGSWWLIKEYDGSEGVVVVLSLEDAGFTQAVSGERP